jgi:ABC-type antimicrobial peptide transport system permease subunit
MQEIVFASVEGRRLAALLLTVLASLALVVAATGLYGVLSYLISQRSRDIAVRMALGARKIDVLRMLVLRALALYGAGAVCGIVGVIWCGRLLAKMLAGIRPWDPSTLGVTIAVLLAIVVLAAWLPARRAASIDPYQALRSE